MRKSPFHPGPLDALTQECLEDLRRIKQGEALTARKYVRLEVDELIQQGLDGWMLTEVGQYRLERGN